MTPRRGADPRHPENPRNPAPCERQRDNHTQNPRRAIRRAAIHGATGPVIANFRQVVTEGDLRIHPLVAKLVDDEMRGKTMRPAKDAPFGSSAG